MAIKKLLFYGLALSCFWGINPAKAANSISPQIIYRQAQLNNQKYFHLLSRYRGAIDIADSQGNTAYCLAKNAKDKEAMKLLANHGADTSRVCPKVARERTTNKNYQNNQGSGKEFGVATNDNSNYYWAAAGVVAAGAGVAALASGGGGGSRSGSNASGTGTPVGQLTAMSADEFKTKEYSRTNFLEGIHAAEAYSYIYKQDESRELFGYQYGGDDFLKTIKVGVLDGGVFANQDLAGKIVGTIDINAYNTDNSVWGISRDGWGEAYVLKKDSKYYLFKIDDIFYYYQQQDGSLGFTEEEMKDIVQNGWGVPFSSLTLINTGGGSNPGVNMSSMLTDLSSGVQALHDSWVDIAHTLSHGTHVAGIIAANKNDTGTHGVAFSNAEIIATSWDLSQNIYNAVKTMVDSGATIINNSWGSKALSERDASVADSWLREYDEDVLQAYAYAASNGAVWVHATGNDFYDNANVQSGMGLIKDLSDYNYSGPQSKYEVPIIAVTALDYDTRTTRAPSGLLADYANWCGSTASYCIAAPGTSVDSTAAMSSGTVNLSGTSMAAPVVSGSIALLNGYYPWLSAQNIAYLLLETANNTGEYADSEKYGRGALDLEAAITTPIGGLGLPSTASFDSVVPVSGSRLSLSSAVQNKLLTAVPESVTAFDALNRPFQYDLKNAVYTTHASNAHLRNTVGKMAAGQTKRIIKDAKSGFTFTTEEALDQSGKNNLSSVEIVNETANGATRFYYAENSQYMTIDNVLSPSANPYLAMNEAYGAEQTLKLSDASKLKLSLQTGENGLYERDYEQDKYSFDDRAYALSGEYSFNMTDYLEVAALGGMLFEDNAMLGMNGTGLLGIKDSSTYYMGIKAALNLTPRVSLLASYYRGYTQGNDAAMLAISNLETESFMLAGEYKLNKTDKIGLSLSSPMSVVKGRASLMYATGRDSASDTIYMNKMTTSLRPEAKEYDLGLYYQGSPKNDLNLTGKVQARFNADGEKGVTDYIGIVGVSAAF